MAIFEPYLNNYTTDVTMDQHQLQFEEAEKILSWRDLQVQGVYMFVGKETRGMNRWNKPITVVTVKRSDDGPPIKFYAPASLHYGLESRPYTRFIRYDGLALSHNGHNQFPVFKYAN